MNIEKNYGGVCIQCDAEGYLTKLEEWTRNIGSDIASECDIIMTDDHWEVIEFIQDKYRNQVALSIRKIGKSGVVSIKEFYQLFPDGPLKKASRIAGIPKPVSCI